MKWIHSWFVIDFRALVGMMMYNAETKDIAKPSELLNSIKAIMSVLQSLENYGGFSLSESANKCILDNISGCTVCGRPI